MKARILLFALGLLVLTVYCSAQQVSDADIRTEIQKRTCTLEKVEISVKDGTVTLTGTVTNLAQRLEIEDRSRRTVGVKEVDNRITVTPTQRKSDEELTKSVRESLTKNLSSDIMRAIQLRVENGVVILTGTLTGSYPKQVAGRVISLVPGVTGIRNEIVVRPAQTRVDSDILTDIRSRYMNNPLVPKQVSVSVANGIVTLTGTVDNFAQVRQAEAIARFTPGVVDVQNRLFVRAGGR